MRDLPRSSAASHSLGPSVTPGMGAKVADTRVAMLRSASTLRFVLSFSSRVGAKGEGELSEDNRSGRAVVTSG